MKIIGVFFFTLRKIYVIILKVAGQQLKAAEGGFFLRVQFKRILRKRSIFTPTAIPKDLNKI